METLKFSIKPHFQNHLCVPQNSRIVGVYNEKGRTFSFTLTCKFKTSKGKKISWPDYDGAPPLLERKKAEEATTRNNGLKTKRVLLGGLLNLPLAIGEMFAVAGLMALGNYYRHIFLTTKFQVGAIFFTHEQSLYSFVTHVGIGIYFYLIIIICR